MRAEDILSDEQHSLEIDGLTVRKGTIGAFIANARRYTNPDTTEAARRAALEAALALVPAMEALRLFEVFAVSDPALANAVAAARRAA